MLILKLTIHNGKGINEGYGYNLWYRKEITYTYDRQYRFTVTGGE